MPVPAPVACLAPADPVTPSVEGWEVLLKSRPAAGQAVTLENFELRRQKRLLPAEWDDRDGDARWRVGDGNVLAATSHLSVDPFQRCRFNDDPGVGYTSAYVEGEPISSAGIGTVLACGDDVEDFAVGDLVIEPFDSWPWQSTAELPAASLTKVPRSLAALVPLSSLLGTVGQTGLTALFGVRDAAAVAPGDTVVISGAGGAVGLAAAQLAAAAGATVIGIYGNPAKGAALRRLGCHAVCYREPDLSRQIAEILSAEGAADARVYFDLVGGEVSASVIPAMARGGSIVLCGQISMYVGSIRIGVNPSPDALWYSLISHPKPSDIKCIPVPAGTTRTSLTLRLSVPLFKMWLRSLESAVNGTSCSTTPHASPTH